MWEECHMRIAVIGMGAMGSRIARRFLDASHDVIVWNRTPARATPVVEAGAVRATSPADAAASADHVVTMLAHGQAVRDVMSSSQGLAEGLRPGQVLIEMSTIGPTDLERLLPLVPAGVHVVDAPVLGSTSEAESGELRVFVGGDDGDFAQLCPLLEVLGEPLHAGPFGSGVRVKLAVNAALLGTLSLLGEIMALAERWDLDRDVVVDALSRTPLAAQAERRRPLVDGEEVPLRFRLTLAVKDADLITGEGERAGAELPVLHATADWFRKAAERGAGEDDYSTVVRHIAGLGESPVS
jgi:3-hydroxyisobutyrate dehydrogenase-like beta-hydroxyacid dehydrogenase